MKLTVMSLADPKDKRTWSKTTSNMYAALTRNGFEVDTLTPLAIIMKQRSIGILGQIVLKDF